MTPLDDAWRAYERNAISPAADRRELRRAFLAGAAAAVHAAKVGEGEALAAELAAFHDTQRREALG